MVSSRLTALVFVMSADCALGLLFRRLQRQAYLHQHGVEAVTEGMALLGDSFFSPKGYASIVALHDDKAMCEFVKRVLALEDKFIPQDQDGELNGFVQWFSGTKASQSFERMQQELSGKPWVKDLKTIDGAKLSEVDYQAVAARHNDTAMSLIVDAVLRSENSFVPQEGLFERAGFVPWFSGTKAIQNLEQMRVELRDKPWVRKLHAVGLSSAANATATTGEMSGNIGVRAPAESIVHQRIGTPGNQSASVPSVADSPSNRCSECIVWGDASILSFNAYEQLSRAPMQKQVEAYAREAAADQFNVTEAGTYWLVHNQHVQIQGRYWRYSGKRLGLGLGAIAVSGPIVGHNTLVIRSMTGKVTWNDQQILHQPPSNFSNEFVSAGIMYDVGPMAGPMAVSTRVVGINFEFGNGERIMVARYPEKLSTRFRVCESDDGAAKPQGQCGSLDHTPHGEAPVGLAGQRAAAKLSAEEIIFPDGRAYWQYKQP